MGYAVRKVIEFPVSVADERVVNPYDAATEEIKGKKAVHPLDSVEEVDTLISYFLNAGRTRDALMCVAQLNFGLRIGDILWMRWKDLFNDDGTLKESNEIKTQKTKAVVEFYINEAVAEAAMLHKEAVGKEFDLGDEGYIFVSNRGGRAGYTPIPYRGSQNSKIQAMRLQPMNVTSACRIVTDAAKACGLYKEKRHISTHSLRKTALNAVIGSIDGLEPDQELLNLKSMIKVAQQMVAHADSRTTDIHYLNRRYRVAAVKKMNLGLGAIKAFKERMGDT